MKMNFGRFDKQLKSRIEGYEFEVGILKDAPRFEASEDTKEYAGGPVKKMTRVRTDITNGDVLVANMKRLGVNLLADPFKESSSDIIKFTKAFLQSAINKGKGLKRVENLIQAIVRNPILRLDYGGNNTSTADAKGFDRHLFLTGQMFKAIRAKAYRVRK